MKVETLRSLCDGMRNVGEQRRHYYRNNYWYVKHIEEAADLLANKEEMLEEYDCYDYLFDE